MPKTKRLPPPDEAPEAYVGAELPETSVSPEFRDFDLNDNKVNKTEAEFLLEKDRWKNRRKMAFSAFHSLLFLVGVVILVFFGMPDRIDDLNKIQDILAWFVGGFISIIGFYFGATAWFDARTASNKS